MMMMMDSRSATTQRGSHFCGVEQLRENLADFKRNVFENLYQNRLDGPFSEVTGGC